MDQQIWEYVASLYKAIPLTVYEGILSVLCIGVIVIITFHGLKRGWRKVAGLILVGYVFVIYCSTVFFRTATDGDGYEFKPFWSYESIRDGRAELLVENIMNVVVFVPVGILLGSLLRGKDSWLIALLVGMGISVSIEAMQYFFYRGFAETDDVMHNTLGCMIGYILVKSSRFLVKGYKK